MDSKGDESDADDESEMTDDEEIEEEQEELGKVSTCYLTLLTSLLLAIVL